ncbi:MAG: branched-chain amino acid ABC transporter permease [Spirochaetaceae bacterium]|jgi:branched-chain amino acid transport system permease protein|nr:branched-chain amino acid ABC transporter permease [Spirochaetaceae bacterium]
MNREPREGRELPATSFSPLPLAGGAGGGLQFPIKNTIILAVVSILCIGLPSLLIFTHVIGDYTARILTMCAVNAVMAISVNMIVGVTGQLSLGQAGFLVVGAYSCIYFNVNLGLPVPIAVIFAALLTALIGFLIGFPVLKLTGDYLAIVTLGFGEIIRIIIINIKPITNGPNGRSLSTAVAYNNGLSFFVVTGALVLIVALLQNFIRSTYGRAILACREDEIAANSSGINIFRYKMIGFVIASFIAGLGGCFFVLVIGFVRPADGAFMQSINYLIYVVLGGMGSMTGSILAAYILTYLQEALRFLQDYRMVIYPALLIIVMIFRPQGLLGTRELSFVGLWNRLTRRRGGAGNDLGGAL